MYFILLFYLSFNTHIYYTLQPKMTKLHLHKYSNNNDNSIINNNNNKNNNNNNNNNNYAWLEKLGVTIRTGLLQKTALLGTARIQRKLLES